MAGRHSSMATLEGRAMLQPSRIMPDQTLLGWVASGDAAALRELEQRHGRSVYALAYGIVIDPGEADEVVAETFAYVWLSAARFVRTANTDRHSTHLHSTHRQISYDGFGLQLHKKEQNPS